MPENKADAQHQGLPVAGYQPQSEAKVALVNEFKADEERMLRKIDELISARHATETASQPDPALVPTFDGRWAAIARTHFQEGFMALNRAVFQPQRIALPEDDETETETPQPITAA